MTLGEAAAEAERLGTAGDERGLAQLRVVWDDEIEAAVRHADYRVRGLGLRAVASFRFRQKLELLRRGLDDESAAARGSALIALESLSRGHPGDIGSFRRLLESLAVRDPNAAVRRLAIMCFRNGAAESSTTRLLDGIAADDDGDDEVRKTARAVSALLVKQAREKKQQRK